MIEIRFHGRGGQGAVLASELLAQAAFLDGRWPQSFPFFGVERRGAPVTAYARVDDRPIRVRTSITTPDVVVVLEPGLLRTTGVTDGLRAGGLLVANSPRPPDELEVPVDARTATVDATAIARAHGLGPASAPIVNTAMLGALARASGVISLASVEGAIELVPARTEENRAAARDGFANVRGGRGVVVAAASPPRRPLPAVPEAPLATRPSAVLETAGWRTLRPVLHADRCTRCEFCWKFCPDDAIVIGKDAYPEIRLPYCKGCGICAVECPPGAIEMVAEEGAP